MTAETFPNIFALSPLDPKFKAGRQLCRVRFC